MLDKPNQCRILEAKRNFDVDITHLLLVDPKGQINPFGNDGRHEFIFKVERSVQEAQTLYVMLVVSIRAKNPQVENQKPDCTNITVDQVKLTIKPREELWSFYSFRGNLIKKFKKDFYPLDYDATGKPTHTDFDHFPDAQVVFDQARDKNKKQYLVFVHGYNVNEPGAMDEAHELYQRFYWFGFRGNFVGLTWDGNPWNPAAFHKPILNAFKTSTSFKRFLETMGGPDWAGKPENINVVAHSLGNLVMWDAVRVHARDILDNKAPNVKLVNNIISVEAAVLREAHEQENDLVYVHHKTPPPETNKPYFAVTEDDRKEYTVAQQKHFSWRFWFQQGNKDISLVSLTGAPYHSWTADDFALLKYNDFDFTHFGGGILGSKKHYKRERIYPKDQINRTPATDVHGKNHFEIPSLLWKRRLPYHRDDLTGLSGRMMNPQAKHNYEAKLGGWRSEQGFPILRLLDSEERNHSDFETIPLPRIYLWYSVFLGGAKQVITKDETIQFPPAIPLGDEGR